MDTLFELLIETRTAVVQTVAAATCAHEEMVNVATTMVCASCGLENSVEAVQSDAILDAIAYEAPVTIRRHGSDEARGLASDIRELGFSKKIVDDASDIFVRFTGGRIYRGMSRKAVILACVMIALQENAVPQSFEKLMESFNVSCKAALKGLQDVREFTESQNLVSHETVEQAIVNVASQFNASKDAIADFLDFYLTRVVNRSSFINRSRSRSVAVGLIYFRNGAKVPIDMFARHVGVSRSTIKKMGDEIARIVQ